MAVSLEESFPARKRRPSAGAFVSPSFSDNKLLQSLFLLSQEILSLSPLRILLKKSSSSITRKSRLLSILLEELLRNPVNIFPPSAALCFEELYIVLQRIKILLEDCSSCSTMWLLLQTSSISNSFHQLTGELLTLLDIFPVKELNLSEDVDELFNLIKKQCSEKSSDFDSNDENLRVKVLKMLEDIKSEIVPDSTKLSEIFGSLNLRDSTSCSTEIENLEDEVQNLNDDKSKSDIVALIGLVRYAKCVLYGASTPRTTSRSRKSVSDVNFPADFRCPISLDLMRDPVVVSTGQTYDRSSISLWIESGHNTCPKTGQNLAHTQLIPNLALKNLTAMWCRDQRIPFEPTETNIKSNGVVLNKTALEATKMTVSFLLNKLTAASQSPLALNRMVHELRILAKTDSDSRACIVEAGALPLLVKILGSEHPNLQVNAVTTILNLSILEANKSRIMETDGVLNGVIEVLRSGATWEAKGNAAATIYSLTGVHAYRKRLGRTTCVVKGLLDLAREGPTNTKMDAMVAILNLAGDREAVRKLVEGGVVDMVADAIDSLTEEAVTILEMVVKRGGLAAVAAANHRNMMKKLASVLRDGSDKAKESAAATLVTICRKGGSEIVSEMASIAGIERVVWETMGVGTGRAKRKAGTLMRILRRWAAGQIEDHVNIGQSTTVTMNSTRIILPG